MIYSVRHTTIFRYEPAVRESIMEVRLQPRSDGDQRCLNFTLKVDPAASIMQYRDFAGNTVHHFDIAAAHSQVTVTAESSVEVQTAPIPRTADCGDWSDLDALVAGGDYWEMLLPSYFACSTQALEELASALKCERRGNPLELMTDLNSAIYTLFAYVPNSTKVDSPIDEALKARQGVCQDFAHIMIALLRRLNIPCRYVSGYMFHRDENEKDRSLEGASHAWVEAMVPRLGWVAFDPTNNLVGADRHIRLRRCSSDPWRVQGRGAERVERHRHGESCRQGASRTGQAQLSGAVEARTGTEPGKTNRSGTATAAVTLPQ
jgi:transglutaminase-like putative cysteine protease